MRLPSAAARREDAFMNQPSVVVEKLQPTAEEETKSMFLGGKRMADRTGLNLAGPAGHSTVRRW